ncbi:MAG TPA: dTDP-4-dehydrorhamnose reductase [Dissulfurispiraceae bacterium]|nr:dTDP-4-dehydrorhamnose reductase [Dissulfurispiraceae bacterium]
MKILLIGKTGQLGGDILRNNSCNDIYAPDRTSLDICSNAAINAALDSYGPQVVINTAAFHNVPLCETDPLNAFRVNCVSVRDLAMACDRIGALLVTFSTDYVFNGEKRSPFTEDDKPAPLQMYGITRIAGEFAALATAPGTSLIIRTSGLYGVSGARSKGGNFVDKRIQDAETMTFLEVRSDGIVSPTYTYDLSKAVLQLIQHPQLTPGIYHLVNEGECSWYEFTKAIYEIMGITVKIKPVDRGGKDGDLRRPLYSVLANTKARNLSIILPHWRDALERYLKEKYGAGSGH